MKKKIRFLAWLAAGLALFAAPLIGDGFIVIPHPPHPTAHFPLAVRYHHVSVSVKDAVATTTVDQEFFNPNPVRLEGLYLFPIPANAAIRKFSMWIDGRETAAELLDAAKARSIYEDIVRRLKDPALLEYDGRGLFKVRIFPIEPRGNKRVKISYSELLSREGSTLEYIYPLNTEKFSSRPLEEVSLKVDIESSTPLKNVYCPSHEAEITRHGTGRATVGFEAKNVRPDADFRLYIGSEKAPLGFTLLTYRRNGEDGYFFLSASPGFADAGQRAVPKDIVFVLDTSGSMAGDSLRQAQKALRFCVENLNSGDRFDIVRFSTEAESLFSRLGDNTPESRQRARAFIDSWQAIGGTAIDDALKAALGLKQNGERPFLVVFITDGKPTIGETDEERLLKNIESFNSNRTRIFTFGIGEEINTHLLDRLTENSRAFRTYIGPKEDIEIKISTFYTKVQSPILTDLELRVEEPARIAKVYPDRLPDLFKGSALTVFGRYSGSGRSRVLLRGRAEGQSKEFAADLEFAAKDEGNDFIPPLWAARRIGFLLDQIRLHGENKELIDEITQLARLHGVVTPYTSYLILEDEKNRLQRGDLAERDQTLAQIAPGEEFARRNRQEFEGLKDKSGGLSVQASREFQDMNQAAGAPQAAPGKERLAYRDKSGNLQNLSQQVRNVQGRAFYQAGSNWTDSRLQSLKNPAVQRIQFASSTYFDLLKSLPQVAQILALGKNVRFAIGKQVYEIYE